MVTKVDGQFEISSSGIIAVERPIQTVKSYTRAVAKRRKLSYGLRESKQQTTDDLLAAADVVVFMNKDVYEEASRRYHVDARKSLVWYVPDVPVGVHDIAALTAIVDKTLDRIEELCDRLHRYLTKTNWVDIYDADNRSTGLRLPLEWATDRGLWFRGVHVVVTAPDGKFIVGKRVKNIVFFPGMLELSLGGAVDAGELPLQAARRETNEELGAELPVKAFTPLFVSKHSHYHPHYKKVTRVHSYNYHARLTSGLESLSPQPTEVAELRALSKRQVKTLLHKHRILHFGRLTLSYKLQEKAVAYSSIF